MFVIHYVVSRESDLPTERENCDARTVEAAAARARSRVRAGHVVAAALAPLPHPIGFLIYDAAAIRLVHREYLD